MKRVYTLYRVSTKGQVDKDDIPMQKTACHEFAGRQDGWIISKEFYEKGISGYKVSADDRDAIQDIKAAAEKHEFDILLVFMFDRLGRRQNETPFVVEWFVGQGIEVWSTQEGQQRFDNEADYLVNYMRFWQAGGESRKTSTRVKTRLRQLTEEGSYTGGAVPLGYTLVKSGQINKKGKELLKIVINDETAQYVRMIFEMTVKNGYGSYRMARYLNELGVKTMNGSAFQCNTINRILKNKIYCGYLHNGDACSQKIDELQIIDEGLFQQAQYILEQRSRDDQKKQHIAQTTKGQTLLSGNIYCASCGAKMNATSYVDQHVRKDGTVHRVRKQRYVCTGKMRDHSSCDGQVAYVATKVDHAVKELVCEYLARIKTTPKNVALERKYTMEISERKTVRKKLEADNEKLKTKLKGLTDEIANALAGESKFTIDTLSMAIESSKEQIRINEQKLTDLELEILDQEGAMKRLDYYYEQFQSWANEFESASMEQQKMIICQLISRIEFQRGYELNIRFNMNYEQFFMV